MSVGFDLFDQALEFSLTVRETSFSTFWELLSILVISRTIERVWNKKNYLVQKLFKAAYFQLVFSWLLVASNKK